MSHGRTCQPEPTQIAELIKQDCDARGETSGQTVIVPIYRRLIGDALTPVSAYRRLVAPDPRNAPSFLFESVVGGERIGRYSFLGARPIAQMCAFGNDATFTDYLDESNSWTGRRDNPLTDMARLCSRYRLISVEGMPSLTGGWVGYAGYDTVRYVEADKLNAPPPDDRHLPDVHLHLYRDMVIFDHVQKAVLVVTHLLLDGDKSTDADALATPLTEANDRLGELATLLTTMSWEQHQHDEALPTAHVDLTSPPPPMPTSSLGDGGYQQAVDKIKQYILAGDAFQVVPSQRFELHSRADPFDVYRSLRVVNPSPYMFYLQTGKTLLVGSSPEILCRVEDGKLTNRPLAGTRHRGATAEQDQALEQELLADPKDRAEHIMLVDLGRNDVGKVATPGTIELPAVLSVERYSHVMHISSTVTGKLRDGLTCWDALAASLPVGTVSGAPKVRAMQIIDEVEKTRRGPYAGAVGHVDFAGNMDMAIALRTIVVPPGPDDDGTWQYHLQAGGGIVADSDPDAEHQETVNKAKALAKAIALADQIFAP